MSLSHGGAPAAGPQLSIRRLVRPDAILFNGGFFVPAVARQKIVEAVSSWFDDTSGGWQAKVLSNEAPGMAVAIGAAYYNQVRRGDGLRIKAGSARAYYVGVQGRTRGADHQIQAVCVLPAAIEEGTSLLLANRDFTVLTNQPVSFTLYSSANRSETHGDVVNFKEDAVHRHAPLVTTLRFGKRSRNIELAVQVRASFTEVGTLELWCESLKTQHRWRLQFELRNSEPLAETAGIEPEQERIAIPEGLLESAGRMIRATFGKPTDAINAEAIYPDTLVGRLEMGFGLGKDAWPMPAIRKLFDALLEVAEGRKKNHRSEARWLNLSGFCLRPGFGALLDDWRITQARKIYMAGLVFPGDPQNQLEWVVLWRRVAGGFNAGQQQEIYQKYRSLLGIGEKKRSGRLNRQLEHESWRLLASLEHLPGSARITLGRELLSKIKTEPTDKSYLWSLGRLGARIPLYGPLNCVVPVETAAAWLRSLLGLPEFTPETASAVAALGGRTEDSLRDISDDLRQEAINRISAAGGQEALIESLCKYVPAAKVDAFRIFGDSLPEGLRLLG